MADRVIQRNDTAARWQSINPILATGEIGIEIDGAKGYKIGDGKTRWNDLPYPANPASIVQDLGNNENAVPSQKLVTEKLSELGSEVDAFGTTLGTDAETIDIDIITGKYVSAYGYLADLSICWYSQPIFVSKNTVLSAYIHTSSSIASISKYENGRYTPLTIYQGSRSYTNVSYVVLEDMYVVFSGYSETQPVIKKSAMRKGIVEDILNRFSNTIQMNGELPNEITDLNDIDVNTGYLVLSSERAHSVANIPSGVNGFAVYTFIVNPSTKSVKMQILHNEVNEVFFRNYWGAEGWSEWQKMNHKDITTIERDIEYTKAFIEGALVLKDFSDIPIKRNEGYIHQSGQIYTGNIGFYSDPIHVGSGVLIEYTASASNVFSAISIIVGNAITPLVLGVTKAHEMGVMYYLTETDMDIIFSGYSSEDSNVKLYDGNSLLKQVNELTKNVNSLYGGKEFIYPVFNNVGYIANNGTVQPITAYSHTDGIELREGQSIIIKTDVDYVDLVSLISLLNNNNTYTSVASGKSVEQGDDGYWTYTYRASENCLVVLSRRNTSTSKETYEVKSEGLSGSVDSVKGEIKELKKEICKDKYGLNHIDLNNPLNRINTTANFTSAIRSWGFVGDSLSSGEIWGFIDTNIELTAQEIGYKINPNGVKESASGYNISQPIKMKGTYPMLYVQGNLGDVMFVKSDAEGTIAGIIPTTTSDGKIYTNRAELSSGNYVRISYPNGITSVEHKESYVKDDYDISWGQFLCRLCGSEGYNYSKGGRQAKTVVNGTTDRDLGQLLKDTQKQAYTIALGQNDYGYINGVGDDTHYKEMGSAEEGSSDLVSPSNPSSHGDSFVGYYSELICRIKNQFNDSLIFLMTCPNKDGSRDEISAVIRKIYEHYSKVYPNQIFLIDLNLYAKGMTDDFKLNGLHLNSQGYLLAAYIVCTYVDWILRNNIEALNGLPLIGTGAKPK